MDISDIPESFLGNWPALEKSHVDKQGKQHYITAVNKRNYTVWVNETYDASGHQSLLETARILTSKIHEQTFTRLPYINSTASSSSSLSSTSSASSQTFKANLNVENIFISDETCLLFDFFKVSDKIISPVRKASTNVLLGDIPIKRQRLNQELKKEDRDA